MKPAVYAAILLALIYPRISIAELLQVSADGTVFLSTDSIEVVSVAGKNKYVKGIVFILEGGTKSPAPYSVTCGKNGGTIVFRKGDGSLGQQHIWKPNGVSVFDSISITTCKIAGAYPPR